MSNIRRYEDAKQELARFDKWLEGHEGLPIELTENRDRGAGLTYEGAQAFKAALDSMTNDVRVCARRVLAEKVTAAAKLATDDAMEIRRVAVGEMTP